MKFHDVILNMYKILTDIDMGHTYGMPFCYFITGGGGGGGGGVIKKVAYLKLCQTVYVDCITDSQHASKPDKEKQGQKYSHILPPFPSFTTNVIFKCFI